jgi:hypothetical protein
MYAPPEAALVEAIFDRLARAPNYSEEAEAFFRPIVVPEEDRHLFTTAPWRGEFRWFRSPNVIPIEKYRRSAVGGSSPKTAVG